MIKNILIFALLRPSQADFFSGESVKVDCLSNLGSNISTYLYWETEKDSEPKQVAVIVNGKVKKSGSPFLKKDFKISETESGSLEIEILHIRPRHAGTLRCNNITSEVR